MKIGRNSTCNCGSGKKYKKCCMNKPEKQKLVEAILKSKNTLNHEARIKQCLHPRKEKCSEKIIKAHAIQNNRILNKLSQNGYVVTMDGSSSLIFQSDQKKGRKIATTFTGFCSYHDKILFQEIEDREFNKSQKQIFLWTYRTQSWHYNKKQEQINANNLFIDNMINQGYEPSTNKGYQELCKGFEMAEIDNNKEKELFDIYLLNNRKDKENYLNNNLPLWLDSVIIYPRLWNRWVEEIQPHANFDFLHSMMREEDDKLEYEYMYTPWNLFDNIS
ncbi:SEC-C metal-binding domain-containing protein [Terrisporobacter petrolearius]|uniref:SEC-C metal-binding domain-containing protein n=1 Tax=Terrisporobacter petrolearius TaxID=1460447 RepID=UPI003AFFC167